MSDDQEVCEWVNVSSGTSPKVQRAVKRLCVFDDGNDCAD